MASTRQRQHERNVKELIEHYNARLASKDAEIKMLRGKLDRLHKLIRESANSGD